MKITAALSAAWDALKSVYTSSTVHLSAWAAGVVASWGSVTYAALARRAYRNPVAARALRLVSQLMAAVPFVVELPGGEMVTDHEMLRLVDRPNSRTGRGYLFDQVVAHLYCGGEIFLRRVAPDTGPNAGRPTATGGSLHLLSPGAFADFVRDAAGTVTGYRFSTSTGRQVTYPEAEILHVRIYNPTDEDRGMPLLLAAARALEQMEAADDWNKSVAAGGGRIPGRLYPNLPEGQQLTPEQVAYAQEVSDAEALERRGRFLPKVMSGSFRYEAEGMTLRDADFLRAGQEHARRIAALIGIPPALVGDEKGGSLTDAGVTSEVRAAYLLTILPLLDFVFGEINAWLSPAYGGARLAYDRDQIEALNEDVNAMFARYVEATGGPFLTPDEAREATNYDPLGGAAAVLRGTVEAAEIEPEPVPFGPPLRGGEGDGAMRSLVTIPVPALGPPSRPPTLTVPLADRVARVMAGEDAY